MKPDDKALSKAHISIAEKLLEKIKPPCKKILFIHPQQVEEQDFFIDTAQRGRYSIYPPYACGILSRNLMERGYQIDILDLNYEMLLAARRENFNYSFWKNSGPSFTNPCRPLLP